jgi:pimeloyl-ACP methyl ester carboxylesterase
MPLFATLAGQPGLLAARIGARTGQPVAGWVAAGQRLGLAEQPDGAPRLGGLATPVLWLAGERDTAFAEVARAAATVCPQGRSEVLAEAGHDLHTEKPREFAYLVAGFLAGLPR